MNFRKMNICDYDKLYDLWTRTSGMGINDIYDSREGIERYLNRNPNTCFVAEDGENIVGAIMSGHDGRRGFIYHTVVDEGKRKNGIGKRLVELATEALREEGISKVALVVFEKNEIGNAFWEGQGFFSRNDLTYRNKALRNLKRFDT